MFLLNLCIYIYFFFLRIINIIFNFQFARIVREALCELELPYILQNVGEGSCRTNLLFSASGSKEVRFLQNLIPQMDMDVNLD